MRSRFTDYLGGGRTNRPPEEVQARIMYDMGRELERIADALEDQRYRNEVADNADS